MPTTLKIVRRVLKVVWFLVRWYLIVVGFLVVSYWSQYYWRFTAQGQRPADLRVVERFPSPFDDSELVLAERGEKPLDGGFFETQYKSLHIVTPSRSVWQGWGLVKVKGEVTRVAWISENEMEIEIEGDFEVWSRYRDPVTLHIVAVPESRH